MTIEEPAPQQGEQPPGTGWGRVLLVAAVTLACFLPVLGAGFVNLDDGPNFLANPDYRGLGAANLRWMFSTFHMGHYQPLSWMTLGLDYLVWEMDPRGYHLTSLALHAATAVVVYFLAVRLLRAALRRDEGMEWAAVAAALFFSIHPLRVESVAWITERRDVLSGLFYAAALLAYVRGVRDGAMETRGLAAAFVLFVLSLLSKAWAITMPALLLVLDVWPLRRREPLARLLLEKVPFGVLSLVFAWLAASAQVATDATRELADFGVAQRLAQAAYGLGFYVWKTLLPLGLQPLHMIEPNLDAAAPEHVGSAVFVVVVTAVLVALRRRAPALLAAWLAYAITVSPVLGLLQSGSQKVADRYTYLACLSFAMLFGAAVSLAARRFGRRRVAALAAAVLVALGALTWRQAGAWHDSVTLWSRAVAVDPGAGILWSNLASAYEEAGRLDEALPAYRRSLELRPEDPRTRLNLGLAYAKQGHLDAAESEWRTLLGYTPGYCEAHFSLGVAAMRKRQAGEALESFRRAVECEPNYVEAWTGLVEVLKAAGRSADAEQAARRRDAITTPYRRPWS